VPKRGVSIEEVPEKGVTTANNLCHEGEFTDRSFEFGKRRTRKLLQFTTQLTPWRAQNLWIKSEKEFQMNSDQVKPNGRRSLK
jgi:hypothetical protein